MIKNTCVPGASVACTRGMVMREKTYCPAAGLSPTETKFQHEVSNLQRKPLNHLEQCVWRSDSIPFNSAFQRIFLISLNLNHRWQRLQVVIKKAEFRIMKALCLQQQSNEEWILLGLSCKSVWEKQKKQRKEVFPWIAARTACSWTNNEMDKVHKAEQE